jgi:RNA polymerase sigma factor (sigma-70 family)
MATSSSLKALERGTSASVSIGTPPLLDEVPIILGHFILAITQSAEEPQKETTSLTDQTMVPDVVNTPQDTIISQERGAMLRQAIAALKPSYQQVLALRFLCGLDYAETAQVLGRKVGTVRVLQFRALKALHKVLVQANEKGSS